MIRPSWPSNNIFVFQLYLSIPPYSPKAHLGGGGYLESLLSLVRVRVVPKYILKTHLNSSALLPYSSSHYLSYVSHQKVTIFGEKIAYLLSHVYHLLGSAKHLPRLPCLRSMNISSFCLIKLFMLLIVYLYS